MSNLLESLTMPLSRREPRRYPHTCAYQPCSKEFLSVHASAQFCSRSCANTQRELNKKLGTPDRPTGIWPEGTWFEDAEVPHEPISRMDFPSRFELCRFGMDRYIDPSKF